MDWRNIRSALDPELPQLFVARMRKKYWPGGVKAVSDVLFGRGNETGRWLLIRSQHQSRILPADHLWSAHSR